jgi:cytochrome d ubiquinol oxidase subunit I
MLWALRRRGMAPRRWLLGTAMVLPLLPLAANSIGWIFTEMGRQPWLVFGLMGTTSGVSPGTPAWEVLLTMVGFTVLYGALAVVEVRLLLHRIRGGLPSIAEATTDHDADEPFSFGY